MTQWESLTLTKPALLGLCFIQKLGDEWIEADDVVAEKSNSSRPVPGDDKPIPPAPLCWEADRSKNVLSTF